MATQEMVEKILHLFSETIQKKDITDTLINSYYRALKLYSDKEIKMAAFRCQDDCEFFPRIPHVIKRIERVPDASKGEVFIREGVRCRKCNEVRMCIYYENTWECRQCYTGLTTEQIKERYRTIYEALDKMPKFPGAKNMKPRRIDIDPLVEEIKKQKLLLQADKLRKEESCTTT